MTNILHITSSILGDNSQSNAISSKVVNQLLVTHGDSTLVHRDLTEDSIPHLTGDAIASFNLLEDDLSSSQRKTLALSNSLIAELQAADVVVLAVPMYNFSIPSTLKSWIDYVARAGITFRYTEAGSEGLLKGKKVYAVVTSGGYYKETDKDSVTPFLKTIFNFLGLDDVEFIHAEGLNISDETRAKTAQQVEETLRFLAAA
ncbi:FMN-dependent NADH-azoreductase [Sneathiella aquimaris]|uniref:FMN-dependent NADH-azoreductase n=1 Tax=Sneathiella aquimaris TaxID=2599305 RepID=UPI00146F0D3D|nr:NAD(P)H-dependent oxidoreductase [Sneathiella aquimaris]